MPLALRRLGKEGKGRVARRKNLPYPVRLEAKGELFLSETIPDTWRPALEPVLRTPEARKLGGWLKAEEAAGKQVYPPRGARLAALALTPRASSPCQ